MLKVSIINDQNLWICLDSISYSFTLESNKLRDGKAYLRSNSFTSGNGEPSFCLKPSRDQENVFYVPLKPYNDLSKDNQIGEWKISLFSLSFNNLKCYKDSSLKNSECGNLYYGDNSFNGNDIRFNVMIDEPKKGINFSNSISTLFKVLAIISGIVLAVSINNIFNASSRRRNKWILIAIIFLIVTFFLGKYGFWAN